MNGPPTLQAGMQRGDFVQERGDEGDRSDRIEIEKARAQPIVDVVRVIGDVVGDRRRLRLEAGEFGQREALAPVIGPDRLGHAALAVALERAALGVHERAVVLDEPLDRLLRQIEAVEIGVAALELGDEAQAVAVVVEAAVGRHASVEGVFAGMAERRVAEIVAERHRLGEFFVKPKGLGERARELRDLDRMGQTRAEVIALVVDEDLRLVREAAKRGRMDDPVAVALEIAAGRRGRLGVQAPARAGGIGGVGRAPR